MYIGGFDISSITNIGEAPIRFTYEVFFSADHCRSLPILYDHFTIVRTYKLQTATAFERRKLSF